MTERARHRLVVDTARSRVLLHTFAEGLLARLAHDLELACTGLDGAADGDTTSGSVSLAAPLRAIEVVGVLGKDGVVDTRALSVNERRDILAKMRAEVFHTGGDDVVRVEAQLEAGAATVHVTMPNGRVVEVALRPELHTDGDGLRATGTFAVSLASMGSDVVKGPMGAFRVKDRVAVVFDLVFVPQPA